MIAYVFWHWPHDEVESGEYERALAQFHAALREAPPDGFHASASHFVEGLSWAAEGGPAYEDWYLVSDWAALGPLNDSVLQSPRSRLSGPHDAVAGLAGGGAGGLYRLRLGSPVLPAPHAYWMERPKGIMDAPARGGFMLAPGMSLWQRQLALGPAPEGCVLATSPPRPPSLVPWSAHSVRRPLGDL